MKFLKKHSVEIVVVLLAVAVLAVFWVQDSNKVEEPTPNLESQIQQAQ